MRRFLQAFSTLAAAAALLSATPAGAQFSKSLDRRYPTAYCPIDNDSYDLTFTATSAGAAGNLFLNVSDTDFVSSGAFNLTIGGTNSGIDGSVTGRAWGGTSNTALLFSGANLISSLGPFTTTAYSGSATGSFNAVANPYSLTIGTQISRTGAGTSTGDLNLQVSVVPEPSTWALMLMGPALIGFVARRRIGRR
jgi:hypothetical protein